MKIIFLGVGDAVDKNNHNTSLLVTGKTNLLLDCGYSACRALWQHNASANFLDAIFISHAHADHYFGLPAVILRMFMNINDKRKKPITIIASQETIKKIKQVLTLGYGNIFKKIKAKINFLKAFTNKEIIFNELSLNFAFSKHSSANLAIRIADKAKTICYSGDGFPQKQTEKLYCNCNLLIHEAFLLDKNFAGHISIKELLKIAAKNKVKNLALVHLKSSLRQKKLKAIKKIISQSKIKVFIPQEKDSFCC